MTIGSFTFTETEIRDVYIIELKRYGDARLFHGDVQEKRL